MAEIQVARFTEIGRDSPGTGRELAGLRTHCGAETTSLAAEVPHQRCPVVEWCGPVRRYDGADLRLLAASGKTPAALRADLFRQLGVAKSAKYSSMTVVSRLDLTKNLSLSYAADFHHIPTSR